MREGNSEREECLKQPRLPSRSQRSVDVERVEEHRRTLESSGKEHWRMWARRLHEKLGRISPRRKGLPRVLRDRLRRRDLHVCASRLCERGTGPFAVSVQGRGTMEPIGRKKRLNYETSYNCTPIGSAEECNLSPGPASGVYLRE